MNPSLDCCIATVGAVKDLRNCQYCEAIYNYCCKVEIATCLNL